MSPSLFAKYKKEREDKYVLEKENAFAVYFFPNAETVYLEDIFVDLYSRQAGVATKLADEVAAIAKERGCRQMLGSVMATANNSTLNLKVLLGYGMRLLSVEGQLIYFVKEI